MSGDPALYGQIVCADDPAFLAKRLELAGLAALCRESAHYAGGRYVQFENDACRLTLERVGANEYLVAGDADGLDDLRDAAAHLSKALDRLALRHRLEVHDGDRLVAYFDRDWPATQPDTVEAHPPETVPGTLIELPEALTRYFHDSALTLESYTRNGAVLMLRIAKEIGPETGRLRFHGVSFLSLHAGFPGDSIRAYPLSAAPDALWRWHAISRDCLDGNEIVYEIVSLEGPVHVIVAREVDYEILGDHG